MLLTREGSATPGLVPGTDDGGWVMSFKVLLGGVLGALMLGTAQAPNT